MIDDQSNLLLQSARSIIKAYPTYIKKKSTECDYSTDEVVNR